MKSSYDSPRFLATMTAIEPAARIVPARALRRCIRLSRGGDDVGASTPHDLCWRVSREYLAKYITLGELGIDPKDRAGEFVLIPEPTGTDTGVAAQVIRRAIFHALSDLEIDRAIADGQITAERIDTFRQFLGPAQWHEVIAVLVGENRIAPDDDQRIIFREFFVFVAELSFFAPANFPVYFPGLGDLIEAIDRLAPFVDVRKLYRGERPPKVSVEEPANAAASVPVEPPTRQPREDLLDGLNVAIAREASHRGNDLKAVILLRRSGMAEANDFFACLIGRLRAALGLERESADVVAGLLTPLLEAAAAGGWPVERRLLYELQSACLAREKKVYAADLVEWVVTLGKQPIKRSLPKTMWIYVARHLRSARRYADRCPPSTPALAALRDFLNERIHAAEEAARADLRPDIVGVLDEVGLTPWNIPERISRNKAVEELLDLAVTRGFLRIGDLRDAIARGRVKLPDLSGPGEFFVGDPLIRANRLLARQLDGVYKRGEIYMRALQRGCSLFFGTRPGRLFTLYAALPFGGAFVFLEAVHHMIEAAIGLIHWIAGKIVVGGAVPADESGPAIVVAADAATEAGGVGLLWVGIVGVVFFLLMHWPAIRRHAVEGARFALFKVPKAIAASPVVRALFHNRATRLFRRYVLTPLAVGGVTAIVARMLSGEWPNSLAFGAAVAAASALFLRTPVGRGLEDRLNEAAARAWRILSVNFVLGLLTWILHFFQAILEAIDRAIYAVDEWLRFREGQSKAVFAFKLVFGAVWFSIAYVFRFAWNLLVEPQINPIKHFPVVTVSHKMLLPLIPSLAKQFAADEKTVGLLVSGVPGIFGFLAWELRENWRLYRANAPAALRPVIIGSHGEKMRALLRPGFHSGIVPKSFAKLRKATAAGKTRRATKLHHTLEHVAEAVHALVEREFVPYLESSRRWGGLPIHAGHALLATNCVRVPIHLGAGEAVISFEEAGGWVIASVAAIGPLPSLSAEQRQAFADALTGLFKLVGVDAIREQASALFGPRGYNFGAVPAGLLLPVGDGPAQMFDYDDGPEIVRPARYLKAEEMVFSDCPLSWAQWVSRWEADEAGKSPMDPLLPGWRVLP